MDIDERIKELESIKEGKDPEAIRLKKELIRLVRGIDLGFTLEFSGYSTQTVSITKWPDGSTGSKTKISWFIYGILKDKTQKQFDTSEELNYVSPYEAKAIHDFINREDVVISKYYRVFAI